MRAPALNHFPCLIMSQDAEDTVVPPSLRGMHLKTPVDTWNHRRCHTPCLVLSYIPAVKLDSLKSLATTPDTKVERWWQHTVIKRNVVCLSLITAPITKVATQGLTGGWCLQCGYAGQRDDPSWDARSRTVCGFITLLRTACSLKLTHCFSSGIFYLLFLDCGWPRTDSGNRGRWDRG